jgi:hypothetical protein
MCDVIEPGTTTTVSDTLEFTRTDKNGTDFFIVSDKDSNDKEKGADIEDVTITAKDGKEAFYQIVSMAENPEPTTLAMFAIGLAGLAAALRVRKGGK